jgi:hypothetical protein
MVEKWGERTFVAFLGQCRRSKTVATIWEAEFYREKRKAAFLYALVSNGDPHRILCSMGSERILTLLYRCTYGYGISSSIGSCYDMFCYL